MKSPRFSSSFTLTRWFVCSLFFLLSACDENRVYQEFIDFDERQWRVDEKPEFEFTIDNPDRTYNVYLNVRNSTHYPYARLFVMYHLMDSTGAEIQSKLVSQFLFDAKSGKPFGKSGLGDLFDHQFMILRNYQFPQPGKYKIQFEQFMRTDALEGMLAVGLRVERTE